MSLPKISMPLFSTTLPSTGKQIEYRPFRVKEEKLLLIAKESAEQHEINLAIRQMIQNCVVNEDFKVDEITIFDMEYLFIKIRAVSVSNIIKFNVKDSDDEQEYEIEVDLNTVEIVMNPDHDKKIMVSDKIGMQMKYPLPSISEKIKDMKTVTDITFETIDHCIDFVFDEEEVYPWDQSSDKEKEEWFEMLSIDNYNDIQDFFNTIPKLEHTVFYTNSQGTEKRVVFRSLSDFFDLG